MKALLLSLALLPAMVSAQTQPELNDTAERDFQAADAELNKIYKKLLAEGDDASDKKLREAQRAWLKFMELHIEYSFPVPEGENPRVLYGSSYPMEVSFLKAEMTKARVKQLKGQ